MLKVWIAGASGQIGRALNDVLDPMQIEALNTDLDELDITDTDEVINFGTVNRPDVIINCAAYTNVDGCEVNHDAAFKANALGPRNLAQAAENGKQVSVLVELKARFDEEHNIVWAKKLEQAGCHVIYGLVGLKTHSKIALVVRREEDGIRRYVHLGTGNYNDSTAKLYTDCGIFTCKESIGEDATAVFNMLSGYSEPLAWNELVLAPYWLRDKFLRLIGREAKNARQGREARIVAKMNSLCDPGIIAALYEASASGVKIDLIVRGICCLRVGIPGVSENISVRSIVGNFLEHSRIFYFYNDGNPEVFMGSADWMPRNLDRRVEIVFPVIEEELKEKALHILHVELEDNVKARVMQPDGTYEKLDKRGKVLINSQEQFCAEAKAAVPDQNPGNNQRLFIPAEPAE